MLLNFARLSGSGSGELGSKCCTGRLLGAGIRGGVPDGEVSDKADSSALIDMLVLSDSEGSLNYRFTGGYSYIA